MKVWCLIVNHKICPYGCTYFLFCILNQNNMKAIFFDIHRLFKRLTLTVITIFTCASNRKDSKRKVKFVNKNSWFWFKTYLYWRIGMTFCQDLLVSKNFNSSKYDFMLINSYIHGRNSKKDNKFRLAIINSCTF